MAPGRCRWPTGLVGKRRPRGRHRRRREPRPCFGELLHLDGSRHPWLALLPDVRQTLIAVVDDATKPLLYAQLVEGGESLGAILTALRAVLERYGIPGALYTDRAGWAVYTPTSGASPDPTKRTQVGRGRSERANGPLQGRLVNELRVAGIRTPGAANRYLQERFLPDYNARFGRAPTDPTSAFVPVGRQDLSTRSSATRKRGWWRGTIRSCSTGCGCRSTKQRGRRTCAGLRVLLRRHLDGCHSVWWGPRCLGWFTATGRPLERGPPEALQWKRPDHVSNGSGQITCQ